MTTLEIYSQIEEKFREFNSLVDKIASRDPKTNTFSLDVHAANFKDVLTSLRTAHSECDALVKPDLVCNTYGDAMLAASALNMIKLMKEVVNRLIASLLSLVAVR